MLYMLTAQCDAQNINCHAVTAALLQPKLKFQSAADHTKHLIPEPKGSNQH
jgi:hypothetical protein